MKKATKPQKPKSVLFTEPVDAAATSEIPTVVTVVEEPAPAPPMQLAAKPVQLPAKPTATVVVQAVKPPRRSSKLKGFFLIVLAVVALVFAGPTVLVLAGAFTYPILILVGCVFIVGKISAHFQRS